MRKKDITQPKAKTVAVFKGRVTESVLSSIHNAMITKVLDPAEALLKKTVADKLTESNPDYVKRAALLKDPKYATYLSADGAVKVYSSDTEGKGPYLHVSLASDARYAATRGQGGHPDGLPNTVVLISSEVVAMIKDFDDKRNKLYQLARDLRAFRGRPLRILFEAFPELIEFYPGGATGITPGIEGIRDTLCSIIKC